MRCSKFSLGAALVFAVAFLGFGARLAALELGCAHCGSAQKCQKICRLVYEEKKVEIVCWGCKCEEFCLPGPSKVCRKNCEEVCDTCDDKGSDSDVCTKPKLFVWREWIPGHCAKPCVKKKLMKKVVVKKIPSYKWVIEDVCEKCEMKLEQVELQPEAEVPPPPAVQARFIPAVPATAPQAALQPATR